MMPGTSLPGHPNIRLHMGSTLRANLMFLGQANAVPDGQPVWWQNRQPRLRQALPATSLPASASRIHSHGTLFAGGAMAMSLLLEYFRELPRRRENESAVAWERRFRAGLRRFQKTVGGRYTEGTLQRLLTSDSTELRQAAVLALGLCGTMSSNRALALMLRDEDDTVKQCADDALWSLWFRADAPDRNEELHRIMRKSAGEADPDELLADFEALLAKAPGFAEAYNQRAVFHFRRGDFLRSITDCQKTLQLNPHHFGAASGMAQCFMKQRKYHAALRAYRRALRINPNLEGVREAIESLENMLGGEGRK